MSFQGPLISISRATSHFSFVAKHFRVLSGFLLLHTSWCRWCGFLSLCSQQQTSESIFIVGVAFNEKELECDEEKATFIALMMSMQLFVSFRSLFFMFSCSVWWWRKHYSVVFQSQSLGMWLDVKRPLILNFCMKTAFVAFIAILQRQRPQIGSHRFRL